MKKKGGFKRTCNNPWLGKSRTNTFSTMSKVEINYLFRHYSFMKVAHLGVPRMKIPFKEDSGLDVHALGTYINKKSYFVLFSPRPNTYFCPCNLILLHLALDQIEFLTWADV